LMSLPEFLNIWKAVSLRVIKLLESPMRMFKQASGSSSTSTSVGFKFESVLSY
jgi:hypothetical protein